MKNKIDGRLSFNTNIWCITFPGGFYKSPKTKIKTKLNLTKSVNLFLIIGAQINANKVLGTLAVIVYNGEVKHLFLGHCISQRIESKRLFVHLRQ